MKWLVSALMLFSMSAVADRQSEAERIATLAQEMGELSKKIGSPPTLDGLPSEEIALHKAYYEAITLYDAKKAQYRVAMAKFIKKYKYVPPSLESWIYENDDGSVNYLGLESGLQDVQIKCIVPSYSNGFISVDQSECPAAYRKLERQAAKLARDFRSEAADDLLAIAEEATSEEPANEEMIPSASRNSSLVIQKMSPIENLGRGYKIQMARAGVMTIFRSYPDRKKPKMILIGYEGIDKLERNIVIPLVFTYGDENKSLEFQLGSEIPEDDVVKGRRILSLQILRFKKKPKEKPDALSNKELAAIEDFIKQFNGKEISDSNNVLLTEIYLDPDDAKKQMAATWRVPFDPASPAVELGYQRLQVIGAAK